MPAVQYLIFALDAFTPFLTGDSIIDSLYVGFAGQVVGAVIVYTVLLRLARVRDAQIRPLRLQSLRTTLFSLAGSIPFILGISLLLTTVFASVGITPETGYAGQLYLELQHLANPFNVVIFFAVGSVGAPIYEELLYRRTAVPLLEQRGASPLTAIVTSAALFGTVHIPLDLMYGNAAGAFMHFVSVMIIGMFLGFVYVTTRNVVFPMLIHAIMNGLSFAGVIGGLSSQLEGVLAMVGLIYLLLLIVGLVVIIRAFFQYTGAPNKQWVKMIGRKSPPCLCRGVLWLLFLFITSIAVLNSAEDLILPAVREIAGSAFARITGAALNLIVLVLFAAIATRTEVAALPVAKEPPTVPDLVSSDDGLL